MNLKFTLTLFTILLVLCIEGKKTGRSRSSGSGRGSSKKTNTNSQPAPTSFSYSQPSSAQKPSFSGWQEQPAQKPKTSADRHSYPSSGTGLSGDKPKQTNNQQSHSYPASTGLSGGPANSNAQQTASKYPQQQNAGHVGGSPSPGQGLSGSGQSGNGYPQQQGSSLSGNGHNYPAQHGSSMSGNGQVQSGNSQSGAVGGYPQQAGSGYNQAPPPYSGYRPGQNNYGNNYHPQGPPPPYSNVGNYGGYGGHSPYGGGYGSNMPGYGSSMPGYFGNYGKGNSGMGRSGSALAGVGIAGAGIGTVLTGLALWNLARSTGRSHHTVIYDNRGQPVAVAPGNDTAAVEDSILADLLNCSLTISNDNKTEVLAIPCAIATSFTPEADVKDSGINENANDNTKCTVTVLTKSGKEFMTTIPCSILLNTASENNVTEAAISDTPVVDLVDNTTKVDDVNNAEVLNNSTLTEPTALKLTGEEKDNSTLTNLNCTLVAEEERDPINPCFAVNHNLTVVPLETTTDDN